MGIEHLEKSYEALDTTGVTTNESFIIDSDQKAEWALRKIAELEEKHNRFAEVCHKQKSFYQLREEEAKKTYEKERSFFVSLLSQYFETITPKITKTQATFELPSGKLIKKREKLELEHDDEKLIELLSGTEFVEEKPNLKWGEYKKTLKIIEKAKDVCGETLKDYKVIDVNGELIEAVTVQVKPESFDVKVTV